MRLLLAEDDETVRFTLTEALTERGYTVVECPDGAAALRALDAQTFDLILSDIRMPGADGISLFRRARQTQPGVSVVLMTAYADTNDAVTVMREGARDYVVKPFEIEELLLRLARVRGEVDSRRTMESDGARASTTLVGVSPAMRSVRERLATAAASEAPVVVAGEIGTGKELCARTIHAASRRAGRPFLVLDCAGLSEPVVESELFGRIKGAAGATRREPGRLEGANGGTLFLEEVTDLPLAIQAKLQDAIEAGELVRPGSNQRVPLDVRFVAGTSRDLADTVANGRFRSDLYYRLNVIDVAVPALRERRQDIPLLAAHFLAQIAARERRPCAPALDPAATAALAAWDFPGNLRELVHALERAVALSRGGVIGLEHLPFEMLRARAHTGEARSARAGSELAPLSTAIEQFQREYIRRALDSVGGHRTRAAALLGISRKSLWERLRDRSDTDRDDA